MKINFLCITILLLLGNLQLGQAQDCLYFKTGKKIVIKVLSTTPTDIIYKQYSDLFGPELISKKEEVSKIVYRNGKVENFEISALDSLSPATLPSSQLYKMGFEDAKKNYYKHYMPAGWTFAATAITGILGLIPAIACSSTPPQSKNFYKLNPTYYKNQDYYAGYKQGAAKKKSAKVWTTFAGGAITNIALSIFLKKFR